VTEVFFCSSRRRHTSSKRDWSSDVCSSDLMPARRHDQLLVLDYVDEFNNDIIKHQELVVPPGRHELTVTRYGKELWAGVVTVGRSEERRVGKGGRSWGGTVVGGV